ncbi:unnamed protein product [Phyllotreta striolata]|uniref:Uncharacterized protein n=1 Tax=Phyllotreta striolata TaxID=444603 RepID=A0A9P0DK99_PHYSR|nr:unnamed protein product [Phyllotreta striolata]
MGYKVYLATDPTVSALSGRPVISVTVTRLPSTEVYKLPRIGTSSKQYSTRVRPANFSTGSCNSESDSKRTMYTNPFSRTHSHVRQIIDKFLYVNPKQRSDVKRSGSSSSFGSSTSSSSGGSKWRYGGSAAKLFKH